MLQKLEILPIVQNLIGVYTISTPKGALHNLHTK